MLLYRFQRRPRPSKRLRSKSATGGTSGADVATGTLQRQHPLNLMLVDGGTVVREALRALIEREPDLAVVAEAATVHEAESITVTPDVIVTDLTLSDARNDGVILRLRPRLPESPILVLTFVGHPATVRSVLRSGATGYVLKTATPPELFAGIRALGRGDRYVQPSVRRDLGRWDRDSRFDLSSREQQVLQLLAAGYTNGDIAGRLSVSVRTVEAHRSRIKDKLDLRTRVELFQYAWDTGLLERDPR